MNLFFRPARKTAKPRRVRRQHRPAVELLETRNLLSPTVPTGLTQTGETVSTATLSWNPSTDPAGIADYVVYSDVPHGHSGRDGGIR